ncbi:MAG: bifunctional proline dehydrogenase/L-glutamate gamma-semialdehyde dehydrogenase PutA [Pseudomonadota bacterium]
MNRTRIFVDEAETETRPETPSREEISAYHLIDEHRLVGGLIERAVYTADERRRAGEIATRLVLDARARRHDLAGVDAFMREYGLSSEEGVVLMCLAEALLRIPDSETADALIAEKLAGGRWEDHLGHSDSAFVNASTWGLLLTGRLVRLKSAKGGSPLDIVKRLVARSGEPVIRQAVRRAVAILGQQFVMGRTIRDALARTRSLEAKGYRISYDMLGEAARTEEDAERFFQSYMEAIEVVGEAAGPLGSAHVDALFGRPAISIKLSALHPRFEAGKEGRLAKELLPRVMTILRAAEARAIPVAIDAEEQDRLEPTLAVLAAAFAHPAIARWNGLGIAVQAYSKRAIPVLRWLRRMADLTGKRIPVRLVKGAYWDSEIKWAQERGLADYPVFTSKLNTDVSFLACARFLLADPRAFYPAFATHNAYAIALTHVAGGNAAFELQRLHGMGEALYAGVVGAGGLGRPCRIYAPVGSHEDLLGYLVRRLLENGANTSFVNRLADEETPVADIVRDPVEAAEQARVRPADAAGPAIARPRDIYLPERKASAGVALAEPAVRAGLMDEIARELGATFAAGPIVDGVATTGGDAARVVRCPHDRRERIGTVRAAEPRHIEAALASATRSAHAWDRLGPDKRGAILEHAADLVERDNPRLMGVLIREAGKTVEAAHAEVRETVDYLRYYAAEARRLLGAPVSLKSPTGEVNTLELRARGPVAAIAPWNFPLAIFTGQVAAALAAGNPVLAKPAAETPVTAFLVTTLLAEAGVPKGVLHLLPGGGEVGAALVSDPRVKAVAFTGSNETAWTIHKALADRRGPIVPFVAETGGLNAMIADSSALPEQVVRDAVRSAFDSAGQRCSAARVLFVQEEIAERVVAMLAGAIHALDVGDPIDPATDIGPLIDEAAQDAVEGHKLAMQRQGRRIADPDLPEPCRVGSYATPAAYEIASLDLLKREVFGPVLHVVRYGRGHLDKVVAAINASGYGLTLGLHSRIASVADYVAEHARVGNLYVNRNQIGAVVGVQPFGGEGLSGTGPKAGGPDTLRTFLIERVRTTDITATGGNYELLRRIGPERG